MKSQFFQRIKILFFSSMHQRFTQIFFLILFLFKPLNATSVHWHQIKAFDEWPLLEVIDEKSRESLLKAVEQSEGYLERKAARFHFPVAHVSHDKLIKTLKRFKEILKENLPQDQFQKKIYQEFDLYKVGKLDEKKSVLFTGYYEVYAKGSREKTDEYCYPLYGKPQDLHLSKTGKVLGRLLHDGNVKEVYWTRQEIDNDRKLEGQNLELVYLKDPYRVYMAHLQGSITVELPNKEKIYLGYAARNRSTHGFSLPKVLHQAGVLKKNELLPRTIEAYFKDKPHELAQHLSHNPSYVFFKERKVAPLGALSVVLTPNRSLSLDHKCFPKAALAFMDLKLYKDKKNHPIRHFVLNQDTGGGIRGPKRCDVFTGSGPEAEKEAQDFYAKGDLYFLLIKEEVK